MRPPVAAALSLALPGAGHFLIREWVRGSVWLAGWLFLAVTSAGGHGPAALILMAIAAVDAFVLARSVPPGSSRPATPS